MSTDRSKFEPSIPDRTRSRAKVPRRRDNGTDAFLQFGAIGKAVSVLETITAATHPLGMADLARMTGLTKPTTHRIVTLLLQLGIIERDQRSRGYVEGGRLIGFALTTLRSSAFRSIRRSILRNLAEDLGETCNFGVLAGPDVVYIDRVEARWPLAISFEVGTSVPAHASAIGKLLLSLEPEARLANLLRAMPLTRYTDTTITEPEALAQALAEIRAKGVATDNQEYINGVVCVAVPVPSADGKTIGGIAVSAPHARVRLEDAEGFVTRMREAADRLRATYTLDAVSQDGGV